MKRKVLLFLLSICLLALNTGFAPASTETMAKFLVSLVRFMEWPGSMKEGNFKIGVYGSFPAYKDIAEYTMGTGLQNRNVDVINIVDISQIRENNLHIIILAGSCCKKTIQKANGAIGSNATLIVSNSPGAAVYGSAINFINKDNKLAYELNKTSAIKNGIRIGRQVTTFAETVIE